MSNFNWIEFAFVGNTQKVLCRGDGIYSMLLYVRIILCCFSYGSKLKYSTTRLIIHLVKYSSAVCVIKVGKMWSRMGCRYRDAPIKNMMLTVVPKLYTKRTRSCWSDDEKGEHAFFFMFHCLRGSKLIKRRNKLSSICCKFESNW